MTSGFISGGTVDELVERDDEWLQAQREIEANRRRKEEEGRQEGGKTLYEVLQQNKAAKQEAFEESIRLKNQFRNLDEDEIEFLDSVLESTRANEEAVKKETTEQLDIFRRQQEEADKASLSEAGSMKDTSPVGNVAPNKSQWAINARKRKRMKGREGLMGAKVRKTSSTSEEPPAGMTTTGGDEAAPPFLQKEEREVSQLNPAVDTKDVIKGATFTRDDTVIMPSSKEEKSTTIGLGLTGYSSDEEN